MITLAYPSNLATFKISKVSFHNLTRVALSETMKNALGLGLKFIPLNKPPSPEAIGIAIHDYARSIRIIEFFQDPTNVSDMRYAMTTQDPDDSFKPQFYVRNKDWEPHATSNATENYLEHVLHDISNKIPWQTRHRFKPHPIFSELKHLRERSDITVRPSDKNLGPVLMYTTDYEAMVMEHLNDRTNYELTRDTATSIVKDVFRFYSKNNFELVDKFLSMGSYGSLNERPSPRNLVAGITSPREYEQFRKFLTHFKNPKVPLFHCMPKLHKTGPLKGRPIAGAVNWITTPLSKLLDFQLQPLIKSIPTILRDSSQLVSELKTLRIPEGAILVTMDVESLYPSMINSFTLKMIDEIDGLSTLSRNSLKEATRFILSNAYVEFNGKIYKQNKGMPMGTNAAVSLANLYMHHWVESKEGIKTWMDLHIPFYRRFIDDIFFIWTGTLRDLENFHMILNQSHPGIKLTMTHSTVSVNFLDLTISTKADKLTATIYQKELNQYLYIPPFSNHSPATIRGFIKGEFTRYARLCSEAMDFCSIWTKFSLRLMARGYSRSFIDKCIQGLTYEKIQQQQSRPQPPHSTTPADGNEGQKEKNVYFKITYHPILRNVQIGSILHKHLHLLPDNVKIKPVLCWKADKNLGRLITSSKHIPYSLELPTVTKRKASQSGTRNTNTKKHKR